MKYKKILLLLLALFNHASCTLPDRSPLGYKRAFLYGVPEGDDNFSKGWRDGCDTSLAIAGSGTLRLVKEKINAETTYDMTHDQLYDKGFNIGSGYCANFLDYNSG